MDSWVSTQPGLDIIHEAFVIALLPRDVSGWYIRSLQPLGPPYSQPSIELVPAITICARFRRHPLLVVRGVVFIGIHHFLQLHPIPPFHELAVLCLFASFPGCLVLVQLLLGVRGVLRIVDHQLSTEEKEAMFDEEEDPHAVVQVDGCNERVREEACVARIGPATQRP